MKLFLTILAFGITMTGCTLMNKGESEELTVSVDSEGLSEDIHKLFSEDILKQYKAFGMEIFGGNKPPIMDGSYLVPIYSLVKSNFADEMPPGYKFYDSELLFSKQNNGKLTINFAHEHIVGSIKAQNSFITGNGNKFSIFYESVSNHNTEQYKVLYIYTGERTTSGIKDLKFTLYEVLPTCQTKYCST